MANAVSGTTLYDILDRASRGLPKTRLPPLKRGKKARTYAVYLDGVLYFPPGLYRRVTAAHAQDAMTGLIGSEEGRLAPLARQIPVVVM